MTDLQINGLYQTCYPKIAEYVIMRNGSEEQAEECFQAAIEEIWVRSQRGERFDNPCGYLWRTAWRAFLRERERIGRFVAPLPGDPDPADDGDDGNGFVPAHTAQPEQGDGNYDNRAFEIVLSAILKMAKGEQEILALSFQEDPELKPEEIAGRLGISHDSVKVKKSRAMENLRLALFEKGVHDFFSKKMLASLRKKLREKEAKHLASPPPKTG